MLQRRPPLATLRADTSPPSSHSLPRVDWGRTRDQHILPSARTGRRRTARRAPRHARHASGSQRRAHSQHGAPSFPFPIPSPYSTALPFSRLISVREADRTRCNRPTSSSHSPSRPPLPQGRSTRPRCARRSTRSSASGSFSSGRRTPRTTSMGAGGGAAAARRCSTRCVACQVVQRGAVTSRALALMSAVGTDFGLRVHRNGVRRDLQGDQEHVVARRDSGLSEVAADACAQGRE